MKKIYCTTTKKRSLHHVVSAHKMNIVTEFLNDHHMNVFESPGNSPDLYSVENAWNFEKTKLKWRYDQYQWSAAGSQKIWITWTPTTDFMPEMISSGNKGSWNMTKYWLT